MERSIGAVKAGLESETDACVESTCCTCEDAEALSSAGLVCMSVESRRWLS